MTARMTREPALSKTACAPETVHARRCVQLTTAFIAALSPTFTGFGLDVTEVESSTGGGARAMQRIVLTSDAGPPLVIGSINFIEKTAELRTLGCALDICRQRFGAEVSIPPREYIAFLDRAVSVLEDLGLQVTIVAHARPTAPPPAFSPQVPRSANDVLSRVPYYLATMALAVGVIGWMVSQW